MDSELLTWVFFAGGLLLIFSEFIFTSGFSLVIGLSGVVVGVLRFLGLLSEPLTAIGTWVALSALLSFLVYPIVKKYVHGETSFKVADEDYEAMDKIVEVLQEINEFDNTGRIRFQGISWKAKSMEGVIPAGNKVKIKYRENLTWIVENAEDAPEVDKPKPQLKS